MKQIIEYINKIKEVDTQGVEPLIYVFEDNVMEFREDSVVNSYTREQLLKNAQQVENGMIVVPKTV